MDAKADTMDGAMVVAMVGTMADAMDDIMVFAMVDAMTDAMVDDLPPRQSRKVPPKKCY